jgi:hypothetical protein
MVLVWVRKVCRETTNSRAISEPLRSRNGASVRCTGGRVLPRTALHPAAQQGITDPDLLRDLNDRPAGVDHEVSGPTVLVWCYGSDPAVRAGDADGFMSVGDPELGGG